MLRKVQVRLQESCGRLALSVCITTMVALVVACGGDDRGVGTGVSRRPVNDLKLPSGNQVTQAEVVRFDDGTVYFAYETKHASGSCAQLSEVRELWTAHVLRQPEAAAALAITLDPTDASGRSHGYRYLKQNDVWTERFSPSCNN